MKKMVLATAFIYLAVGVISFGACNNDEGGASGGDETEESVIVSDKVTKEEWLSACAMENFANCRMDLEVEQFYDGQNYAGTAIYCYENDKGYQKTFSYVRGTTETYQLKTDEGLIEYIREDDGDWEKHVSDNGFYYEFLISGILNYDDFEYSEQEKGYFFESRETVPGGIIKFLVKIRNGKIATIYGDSRTEDMTMITIMNSSFTYGGQTVVLPEALA